MVFLVPEEVNLYPGCERSLKKYLGGSMGVQIVILGYQNSTAAQMDGFTFHHWSGIPVRAEVGTSGTKKSTKLFSKCQSLRFRFIDEISMVSAGLIHALDKEVSRIVCKLNLYQVRPDGSERSFGGINLGWLGDLLQIPPVSGHSLCSNLIRRQHIVYCKAGVFWLPLHIKDLKAMTLEQQIYEKCHSD